MTLLLSRDNVAQVLTMPDCIAAVEAAFAALARGEADMPQRAVIKVPEHHGLFLGMPAYLGGAQECLGLKLVTVYPDNPAKHGLATTLGTLMLCDPATGAVTAIMDAGYLTAVRTGAASGVATRYLAREDASGVHHLRRRRPGPPAARGREPRAAPDPGHVLDVRTPTPPPPSCATSRPSWACPWTWPPTPRPPCAPPTSSSPPAAAPRPVLDGDWVQPGTHINNIGSHAPTTRELDTKTVQKSYYVADLREANLAEAGDLLIPIAEGAVTADHIQAELGQIVLGDRPGRSDDQQITVFKSCGLAVQDVSTATPWPPPPGPPASAPRWRSSAVLRPAWRGRTFQTRPRPHRPGVDS